MHWCGDVHWLNLRLAAKYLSIPEWQLRALMNRGVIPADHHGKVHYFSQTNLDAFDATFASREAQSVPQVKKSRSEINAKNSRKHGYSKDETYEICRSLKRQFRDELPDEWKVGANAVLFYEWVVTNLGPRPSPAHWLTKKIDELGWCPGNLEWWAPDARVDPEDRVPDPSMPCDRLCGTELGSHANCHEEQERADYELWFESLSPDASAEDDEELELLTTYR